MTNSLIYILLNKYTSNYKIQTGSHRWWHVQLISANRFFWTMQTCKKKKKNP